MTLTKLSISVLIGGPMLEFFAGLIIGAVAGIWWIIKDDDDEEGLIEEDKDEDNWNYR